MEALAGTLVGQYLEALKQDSLLDLVMLCTCIFIQISFVVHESVLTNPLACISLKVLTAE